MRSAGLDQFLSFFFRPRGRIGRLEYALGIGFIYALVLAILAFVLARGEIEGGVALLVMAATLPLTIATFVIVAKRSHDLGLPGTFALLLFVPLAGFVWLIVLCFIPGTAGPNAYGAAPLLRSE